MYGQPMGGTPVGPDGQPMYGQPMGAQPMYGQPMGAQPMQGMPGMGCGPAMPAQGMMGGMMGGMPPQQMMMQPLVQVDPFKMLSGLQEIKIEEKMNMLETATGLLGELMGVDVELEMSNK